MVRRGWRVAVAAPFVLAICLWLIGGAALAAESPGLPRLDLDAASGPPGMIVKVGGAGFTAGATYGLCILPADQIQCGYFGVDLGSFTATVAGLVPGGVTAQIPDLLAGSFRIVATAPGTGAIVTGTPFGVTAPGLALDPPRGPSGAQVSLGGTGYAAGARYTACLVPPAETGCGYVGLVLGDFTTDATGGIPTAVRVRIPGLQPGRYQIGAFLAGGNPILIATAGIDVVAPMFTLGSTSGAGGTVVQVRGSGLAPGVAYTACLVPAGQAQCGGTGVYVGSFVADGSGALPADATVTIPVGAAGDTSIGIVLNDSTPFLIVTAPFARAAGTAAPTAPPAALTAIPTLAPSAAAPAAASPRASGPGSAAVSSDGGGGFPFALLLVLIAAVIVVAFVGYRSRRAV